MNTRRPTDAAGEHWRKWGDKAPPPDPLSPDDLLVLDEGLTLERVGHLVKVRRDLTPSRWSPLVAFVLGAVAAMVVAVVVAFVLAALIANAAPRSAQPAMPAAGVVSVHAASGNLAGPIGAPPASPPLPLSAAQGADSRSSGAPITEPDAQMGGDATWCAPTPTRCRRWGGDAHLGAMESFRYGDRPYEVTVAFDGRTTSVLVVSFCACPQTLIDLSPAAFAELAPLSRGRIPVTVTVPSGPGPTPPPTDTEP